MKSTALILLALIITTAGCASLSDVDKKSAQSVKVTDLSFLNTQSDCQKMGPVSGTSFGDVGGQSSAIEHMRLMAASMGANIISSNLQFTKAMGLFAASDAVNGIALKCPAQTFAKVTSIDSLAAY